MGSIRDGHFPAVGLLLSQRVGAPATAPWGRQYPALHQQHCITSYPLPCSVSGLSSFCREKKKEKRKLSFYKAYKHSVRILCITGKMISQDITMTYFTS